MIKQAQIYRLTNPLPDAQIIEAALQAGSFTACTGSQEKSAGWAPPREENGLFLESVGEQWILKLLLETKVIPSSVVKRKAEEEIANIESVTGRKSGKKEKREIFDYVRLGLLPMAFAKQRAVTVWIDPQARLLVIDAGNQTLADEVLTQLVRSIDGLSTQLVNTQMSPASAMAQWLSTKEAPNKFSVDRECELKACDDSKSVVRYGRHALDTEEVAQHIATGKMPTRLALTFNDRVSFVLTDALQIKKIDFLDVVFEADSTSGDHADDGFDADVAIMTGELSQLIPAVIEALGGETLVASS